MAIRTRGHESSSPLTIPGMHSQFGAQVEQHDGREAILERTLQVWQPRTDGELTREDAREIVDNVVGFFRLLIEWDAQDQPEHEVAGDCDAAALERFEVGE